MYDLEGHPSLKLINLGNENLLNSLSFDVCECVCVCAHAYLIYMASIDKFDHGSTSCCPVCSIVAALLVAVETDVGETISATKDAFVCCLWSVGVVALLSAYLRVL